MVDAEFGADNPAVGNHTKVAVPTGVALSDTVPPVQITVDVGETFSIGSGFTVTAIVYVSVHPFISVPVTV